MPTNGRHVRVVARRKYEVPSLKKISGAVAADATLPTISHRILRRTLREMNFRYLKRDRKSVLIEKEDIVLWRRKYLRTIRQLRGDARKVYYLDETWINEGHTVSKVWQDLSVTNNRDAFLEGWSTGLTAPSGKGRRIIITHVGSDSGFLEDGLLCFESKKGGDYHEEYERRGF